VSERSHGGRGFSRKEAQIGGSAIDADPRGDATASIAVVLFCYPAPPAGRPSFVFFVSFMSFVVNRWL